MRSQVVGNVNVERVNLVDAEGNSELVEGRDDTAQQIPAPRQHTNNGTRQRNIHTDGGFQAGQNDLSARFGAVQGAYESMNRLTDAIAQAFAAPQHENRRGIREIMSDFTEVSQNRESARADQQEIYNQAFAALTMELHQFTGSGVEESEGAT